MLRISRIVAVVVLLTQFSCVRSDPVLVPGPTVNSDIPPHASRWPYSFCHLFGWADQVVRARVMTWGQLERHEPANYAAGDVTPVKLEVLETLRGTVTGTIWVYMAGPVVANNFTTMDGPLARSVGKLSGYFVLGTLDGKMYVHSAGYFWPALDIDDGVLVRNDGEYQKGIGVPTLKQNMAAFPYGAKCDSEAGAMQPVDLGITPQLDAGDILNMDGGVALNNGITNDAGGQAYDGGS